MEKSYAEKAWELNEIVEAMNDEEAYYGSGWLFIWPDGERREDCDDDFGDKESYEELEDLFKEIYADEEYHEGGLFTNNERIAANAHEWDKILGLSPIQVIKH